MRSKPLSSVEWGKIYNKGVLQDVIDSTNSELYRPQTKEVLALTREGDRILEIGCGSGASSLALAKSGRQATALDFSDEAVDLVSAAARALGLGVKVVHADATEVLPFEDRAFDVVFHAGLLEHFEYHDRVRLLRHWSRVCRRMISFVPNASSLAYRIGKARQERLGIWPYGMEIPLHTQAPEFHEAGYAIMDEYSIGPEHALEFLPRWHPMRWALSWLLKHHECDKNCGQGYLLVTIGEIR